MDFDENLIVGEPANAGVGQRQVHIVRDTLRERQIAVARHQFHVCIPELGHDRAHFQILQSL